MRRANLSDRKRRFPGGDTPGAPLYAAGKLFAPEAANIGSFLIRTGGVRCSRLGASGDGQFLLASYEVIGIGFVLVDSGIVTVNPTTASQQLRSSYP